MLGVFMLAAGITEIVAFAGTSGVLIGASWLLLDGVLTVIMSLFLLFNQWFTLLSLPFLFTVWLMFSGLSRFVSAFDLHAPGVASGAGGCAEAINKKRTAFFEPNGWLEEDGVFLLFQELLSGDTDACQNFCNGQTHEDPGEEVLHIGPAGGFGQRTACDAEDNEN